MDTTLVATNGKSRTTSISSLVCFWYCSKSFHQTCLWTMLFRNNNSRCNFNRYSILLRWRDRRFLSASYNIICYNTKHGKRDRNHVDKESETEYHHTAAVKTSLQSITIQRQSFQSTWIERITRIACWRQEKIWIARGTFRSCISRTHISSGCTLVRQFFEACTL